MGDPDDELTIEIELRSPEIVGHRLIILSTLIRMASLVSNEDDERAPDEIDAELGDLAEALELGPWSDEVSRDERAFVRRLRQEWDEEDVLAVLWRIEALAALAWASSLLPELSPAWQQADAPALIARIPAPWDAEKFSAQVRLRTEDEIAAERERAELWAWRAGVEEELRGAPSRERAELLATIREAAREAAESGLIDAGRDDFLVRGRHFASVEAETQAVIAEISLQRLWALNWLCGFGDDWDTVPLDV